MILKKITLENIRSYEKEEIEFPLGSVLLSGDIGSGKTSVLLGIEFALFGLQPSQRGNSLLKNGKKQGRVILELDLNGKNVIIDRVLKKSGKNIAQEESSITIDNEKFEGSVTEIKNRVLSLLNYPLEFSKKTNLLYKFTVYTPQEEMKQIILESSETRLNTLRHIFGIDKYKRVEENVSVFTSKLREEIRNKEGQLSDMDMLIRNLEDKKSKINLLKEAKDTESKILGEKIEEMKKVEEKIKTIEGNVKEKENLEKEKGKSEIMLMNKRESQRELKITENRLREEIDLGRKISFDEGKLKEMIAVILRNKEQERYFQNQMINLSSKLNSLQAKKIESENLKEKISRISTCPTCLQEVNEQYKNNIFRKVDMELQEIEKDSIELKRQKEESSASIESLKKQTLALEEKKSEEEIKKIRLENLKEKEAGLEEILKKKRQAEMDIEILTKQVATLESSIEQFSKYVLIYTEIQREREEKRTEERRQEMKLVEINKEIELTTQQTSEIQRQIEEKKELKSRLEYLKGLESWLSDKFLNLVMFTEKNVMLKLREDFSKLFAEWFSVLVPESLSARLDEQFSPIIEQQGFEISYNYLSGGERTAVALAYRLALNQVINSLLSKIKTKDLIILDEPTDGFSETQLDKMRDVLAQLNVAQLILVSHEAKIESFVESIIKFKKENNITHVER